MRIVFHTADPAVVKAVNFQKLMRVTPAGIEMRERKIGIIRPKRTVQVPLRSKNASVFSMSEVLTSGSLPMSLRVRSLPSRAPTP